MKSLFTYKLGKELIEKDLFLCFTCVLKDIHMRPAATHSCLSDCGTCKIPMQLESTRGSCKLWEIDHQKPSFQPPEESL